VDQIRTISKSRIGRKLGTVKLANAWHVDVYTSITELTMQTATTNRTAVNAATGGIAWIAAALTLGVSGVLVAARPPAPQILILSLTAAAIWITSRSSLRTLVDTIPIRALVAMHAVRFIGFAFLALSAQGALSPAFANPAGWGDVAVAASSLGLIAFVQPTTPAGRRIYLGWNVFATLDLIVAVASATMVALSGEAPGVAALLRAPMVLVPLFVVPLLFASHVIIFRRLRQSKVT
jgi:hypothetical protein